MNGLVGLARVYAKPALSLQVEEGLGKGPREIVAAESTLGEGREREKRQAYLPTGLSTRELWWISSTEKGAERGWALPGPQALFHSGKARRAGGRARAELGGGGGAPPQGLLRAGALRMGRCPGDFPAPVFPGRLRIGVAEEVGAGGPCTGTQGG